jgi:hypothetical protein
MAMPAHPRGRSVAERGKGAIALVVALAIAPVPIPSIASAAPTKNELEKAKRLFFEGLDLEKDGRWADALARFEQVAKARMTPQVRFHIALCKEHLGRLVEALADFEAAEADAKVEGVAPVLEEAPQRMAAIRARLAKLVIKLPSDVDDAIVTLDGAAVDPKGAEEILVDPGTHSIKATAEGRPSFETTLTLGEGEAKTVYAKLGDSSDPAMDPDAPPGTVRRASKPADTPRAPFWETVPTPAWIAAGAGAASLLVASGFYLARGGIKTDLDAVCGEARTTCPPDQESAISRGGTYTTLGNVFLVLGVVGIGAGAYLWVSAPKGDKGAALRLVPSAPGANVAGLSIDARF